MRALALAVLLSALAGCREVPFVCTADAQCMNGAQAGWCELNQRCSFPDDSCPESRRRYAPFGTDEQCVPPAPACEITGLVAGASFSCAWSNAGRVSCWGDNGSGQLGDGTTTARSTAARAMVTNVVEVVAGAAHACARHRDGTVSCWGDNGFQQLGLGDGSTGARSTPVKLTTVKDAADLIAGGRHTCARSTGGALTCWGRNNAGQLGDGTMMMHDRPTAVVPPADTARELAAGSTHTCATLADGTVTCWGGARGGPLNPGLMPAQATPAPIGGLAMAGRLAAGDGHTCAIAGGEVLCFGLNDLGQAGDRALGRLVGPTRIGGTASAVELSAGTNHTCARLEDGSLRCWGSGAFGQLGVAGVESGTATVPAPGAGWRQAAAGARHSCGLTASGEVFCWGRSTEGQLGDGSTMQWLAPDMPVAGAADLIAIAAGTDHTCGLTKAGGVLCWGRGDFGQLANGDASGSSRAVAVMLPGPAVQVVSGNGFSCARLGDGSAHCWGRGNRGQIGDRTTTDHPRPAPVAVPEPMVHLAAGTEHACAVTMSGAAYCWGEAANGRLGNSAMMSSAQGRPLPVPGVGELAQIGAGAAHTCALTRQRTIVCWGASNYGQAGVGPAATPTAPTPMAGLGDATALAIGGDHSCAVVGGGMVRCWGRGDSGQLGFGTTASGTGLTQPVTIESFGPAGAVSAAASHTCAIVNGAAHCWGANRWGQLGNGKTTNSSRPGAVMKLAGVVAIDGGDRHTCAVLADGTATCWGSNQYGQLGNGVPLERPTAARVMLECP